MCVCVCVYLCVYVCIYVCVYVCMCVCVSVYVYESAFVCAPVCECLILNLQISICVYCLCVCVLVCLLFFVSSMHIFVCYHVNLSLWVTACLFVLLFVNSSILQCVSAPLRLSITFFRTSCFHLCLLL